MSSQGLFALAWLLGTLSVVFLGTGLVMGRHERVVARRRARRHARSR